MEAGDKDNLAQLVKAYDKYKQESEDLTAKATRPECKVVPDEDLRKLRSGHTHERIPTPPPLPAAKPNPAAVSLANKISFPNTPPPQPFASTIKVLPTAASVREFTGSDPDYSAREFIHSCEDVMANSCITEQIKLPL